MQTLQVTGTITYGENIKNLIRKMLKFEENDRISIPELLEDEIMYNNIIVKGNYILLDII